MKITVEFDSVIEFQEFLKWNESKQSSARTLLLDCHELSQRTFRVLTENGIEYIEDAFRLSDEQLLRFPSLGRKSLNEIRSFEKQRNPAS